MNLNRFSCDQKRISEFVRSFAAFSASSTSIEVSSNWTVKAAAARPLAPHTTIRELTNFVRTKSGSMCIRESESSASYRSSDLN